MKRHINTRDKSKCRDFTVWKIKIGGDLLIASGKRKCANDLPWIFMVCSFPISIQFYERLFFGWFEHGTLFLRKSKKKNRKNKMRATLDMDVHWETEPSVHIKSFYTRARCFCYSFRFPLSLSHRLAVRGGCKMEASSNKHTLFINCEELLKPDCCCFRWVFEFRSPASTISLCPAFIFRLLFFCWAALCARLNFCPVSLEYNFY